MNTSHPKPETGFGWIQSPRAGNAMGSKKFGLWLGVNRLSRQRFVVREGLFPKARHGYRVSTDDSRQWPVSTAHGCGDDGGPRPRARLLKMPAAASRGSVKCHQA